MFEIAGGSHLGSLGSLRSAGVLAFESVFVGIAFGIHFNPLCHVILSLILAVLVLDGGCVTFAWRSRICFVLFFLPYHLVDLFLSESFS